MDTLTDKELDQLLDLATKPEAASGAASRAVARAFAEEGTSNVVAMVPRQKSLATRSTIAWLAALPLAASLAAGIYLGALGSGNYLLPESLGGGVLTEEDAVSSVVEDMEDLTDEDVS